MMETKDDLQLTEEQVIAVYVDKYGKIKSKRKVDVIVRCKDCKYYKGGKKHSPTTFCRWKNDGTQEPDDYCSWGVNQYEY